MRSLHLALLFIIISFVATAKGPNKDSLTYSQIDALTGQLIHYQQIQNNNQWIYLTDYQDSLQNWVTNPTIINALRNNLELTGDLKEYEQTDEEDKSLNDGLKKFQERNGLEVTGRLDKSTLNELNYPISKRIDQLELNIERWEYFLLEGEPLYVLVNIPDFTLQVMENGKSVLKMKIIVGKKSTPTNVFDHEIEQIVLNPSWYVPNSIEKNELIYKIKKDSSYLEKNHMKLYTEGGNRKLVSPEEIDWTTVSRSNFNYSIEQIPGPWNALGKIKFLFPNSYNIYLHDTPEKQLFKQRVRAFSHGCIRVEKPFELAAYLLKTHKSWNLKELYSATENNTTKVIRIENNVPVSISYFTAWIDPENQLQLRQDVYGLDKKELRSREKTVLGKVLNQTADLFKKIF